MNEDEEITSGDTEKNPPEDLDKLIMDESENDFYDTSGDSGDDDTSLF